MLHSDPQSSSSEDGSERKPTYDINTKSHYFKALMDGTAQNKRKVSSHVKHHTRKQRHNEESEMTELKYKKR